MSMTVVPTRRTRAIAVRMVRDTSEHGAEAVRLVTELDAGQELALLAALAALAAGSGSHQAPGPEPVTVQPTASRDLIVCGTCAARIDESCKTRAGRSRADHADRLFPRRCPCGEVIPKKRGQRWCAACRAKSRRANQQRYDRARRTGCHT